MDKKRLDNAFARYAETRAPGDLARVFDLAAPDLYRIALHLCHSATDAEDVLQATFLAVIESAETWKRGRAAAPWLNGILANRARAQNRRRSREQGTRDPDRQFQRPTADLVGEREDHDLVVAEVDRLPEAERRVVVLSCWYGMKPAEIAHALEDSPGAVRVRLHRALEKLRGRVPAHVVLPAVILALATPGVAAVRSVVLAKAAALASASVATGVVGGLIMSTSQKVVVAALAVALLGSLGWLYWYGGDADGETLRVIDDVSEAAPPNPRRGSVDDDPPPAEKLEARVESDAEAATDPVAPQPPRTPATGDLTLRLRWKDDHAPAANVAVRVIPWSKNSLWYAEHRVSDGDGVVDLDGLAAGRVGIYCEGRRGGGSITLRPADHATKVIDVDRGVDVDGVVVDPDGRPVAGAEIHVGDGFVHGCAAAVSDGVGRFLIVGLQYRRVAVGARKDGYAPSPFLELTEEATAPLELVLAPTGGAVAGRVVDRIGEPIEDAVVLLQPTDRHVRTHRVIDGRSARPTESWRCDTGSDGSFSFTGVDVGKHELNVRAPGRMLSRRVVDVTPDGGNVLVRMLPGAYVSGIVSDGDGRPVAQASVGYGSYGDFDASSTTTDAEGRYALQVIVAGPLELRAGSKGLGERREVLDFDSGRTTTWSPVLAAGRVISGRVVDADRVPAVGLTVNARSARRLAGRNFWIQTKTDQNGAFTLVNCEDEPYRVEIERWSHDANGELEIVTLAVRSEVTPNSGELEIVLGESPEGAWITGVVVDAEGEPIAGAAVEPMGHASLSTHLVPRTTTDAEGVFTAGPIMPGKYALWINARGFAGHPVGTFEFSGTETRDLGRIVLLEPGFLSVGVTIGGEAVRDASFDLAWIRSADETWGLDFEIHADADRSRSQSLTPGVYEVGVSSAYGAFGNPRRVEIGPGETVRVDFAGTKRE